MTTSDYFFGDPNGSPLFYFQGKLDILTKYIMYDYTIEKTRFGLYISVLKDGTKMVTGLTEDGVKIVTDTIHIPVLKGEFDGYTSEARSSVVAGKL